MVKLFRSLRSRMTDVLRASMEPPLFAVAVNCRGEVLGSGPVEKSSVPGGIRIRGWVRYAADDTMSAFRVYSGDNLILTCQLDDLRPAKSGGFFEVDHVCRLV